jgi:hypothetical protein
MDLMVSTHVPEEYLKSLSVWECLANCEPKENAYYEELLKRLKGIKKLFYQENDELYSSDKQLLLYRYIEGGG